MEQAHTSQELLELQRLPLKLKISLTKQRIREFVGRFGTDGVYVSFSGGKDSTVLLDIIRGMYGSEISAVFCDTGLEWPEVRAHARQQDGVVVIYPEKNFRQVLLEYGYPFISKEVSHQIFDIRTQAKHADIPVYETNLYQRKFDPDSEYCKRYPAYCLQKYSYLFDAPFPISHMCCSETKKKPFKKYEKETGKKGILATMACESRMRRTKWLQYGCNAFDCSRPNSKPMSFWTEQDVLAYIAKNELKIASVYGEVVYEDKDGFTYGFGEFAEEKKLKTTGLSRTGCVFCGYGCHLDRPGACRFERLKKTHPKLHDYIMRPWEQGGLNYKEVIDWLNEHGGLNIKY